METSKISGQRLLGIDPGDKNIGIAVSDPTCTIAQPLRILKHKSRLVDASVIAQIAVDNSVKLIIVGQSVDQDGKTTYSGRKAARLAAAIRNQSNIKVLLWDESFSTAKAREAQAQYHRSTEHRKSHHDDIAAAIILQSYMDAHPASE